MDKTILIMMHRIARGGAETQFRYLSNALADRGYKVVLCLENYHADTEDDTYIAKMNPHLTIVKMGWNYYDSTNVPRTKIRKIQSLLRALVDSASLIKKHNVGSVLMYSRMALVLIPVFKLFGVKVVFSERNTGETILGKKIYAKILKNADEITANSTQATEYYKRNGFDKVRTVYNGVEHRQFTKHDEKISFNDGISVLVPARVSPIKNQMLVIKAVEILHSIDIHVDFAGNIEDDSYYQQLIAEVQANNISDKITFCGHVEDMRSRYYRYDLVILPSLAEGMPNVLLESASAKVMSFYSNISMNLDVMQNEEYSFAVNQPGELAELIKQWIHEDKRKEIVEAIYQRTISNYGMENMVNKYVSLLTI